VSVPVKAHAYVINRGDMIHEWTVGYYRSAPFFMNAKLGS
jgi:isopenicillin N synthase-like dioxygenase